MELHKEFAAFVKAKEEKKYKELGISKQLCKERRNFYAALSGNAIVLILLGGLAPEVILVPIFIGVIQLLVSLPHYIVYNIELNEID